ncbi:amino acid/polyamine transporter I [Cunninghamella echinulata]|nr:amino acid/polyamine transporter I [Cunninghamella echinulata]
MWGDIMRMGGSVAVIYGFLLVSIFTFGVGLSLAELCSSFPITGGLYVWVSRLAPPSKVPLLCWVTGYLNWLGLSVAITSADLGLAQFLASVITITPSQQQLQQQINVYWQYGIFLIIIFVHGLINSLSVKYNGIINQTSLYWHLMGTLLIIIVALALTPNKPSATWVFTYFENDTGFSSNIYAFCIGLLQSQYTLSGFDGAIQISNETINASINAPKGILYAIASAAICGLAFLISVNFCVQDFQQQIVHTKVYPQITQVFLDGVGYHWMLVFTAILIGAMFFSGSALTLSSSRLLYAFALDGATPFSHYLCRIHPKTRTPVFAVWANVIFAALIGLLFIISTTAYNAIVSVNTVASSFAYFIPIFLRLTVARKTFQPGPFHLGKYANMIHLTSCCWILFTSVLFLCPTEYPITPLNMNYSSLIITLVIGASVLYYQYSAKYWFTGPERSTQLSEGDDTDPFGTTMTTTSTTVSMVEDPNDERLLINRKQHSSSSIPNYSSIN